MRVLSLAFVAAGLVGLAGCASTEWVNPKKPKNLFTQDYNKCENSLMQDPKVQAGSKALLYKEIDRCLAKEGWMLVEKP